MILLKVYMIYANFGISRLKNINFYDTSKVYVIFIIIIIASL